MQRGEGPPCQLIRKRAAHQLSPYHLTLQREKGNRTGYATTLFIPSLFSTAQANETVRVYSPLNTGWFPRSASTFPHETSLAGSHAPLAIGMGNAPLPAKAPQIGGSKTPLDGKK